MKVSSLKEILLPALVLLIICGVITALLAGTNQLTYEPIQNLNAQSEDESRRRVLPEAESFTEVYDSGHYFIGLAEDGLTPVGYVFVTEAKGYGGNIRVMTGITAGGPDGKGRVTGVEILAHEETPGLGANAQNGSFTNQFHREITGETGFSLYGSEDMGIDAMTGATITSRAVVEAVNLAVAGYLQIMEEVNAP